MNEYSIPRTIREDKTTPKEVPQDKGFGTYKELKNLKCSVEKQVKPIIKFMNTSLENNYNTRYEKHYSYDMMFVKSYWEWKRVSSSGQSI